MLQDLPYHETTLFTDVSTSFGAGAWFGDLCIQFAWEQLDVFPQLAAFYKNEVHINVLELFVVYIAAVFWKTAFKGRIIRHLGDNKVANS